MLFASLIVTCFSLLAAGSPLQFPLLSELYQYSPDHDLSKPKIDQLFELHKLLVQIPSVSYSEYEVSTKLADYLRSHQLSVDLQRVAENRYNVFAYKGYQNDTKVLLTSHIDTVPPFFPYKISKDGKRIYGRGSTDAKGSVAAQVISFLDLLENGDIKEGDLSLLFVVGEENGGHGMQYVNSNIDYHWETVIFGEPTENKLGVGHKGGYGGVLNVTGLASHSGYPELGINANTILVEFLSTLLSQKLPFDDLLGNSSLNIGEINGGVAANVIPDHAQAILSFRVASHLKFFQDLIPGLIKESKYRDRIEFFSTIGKGRGPVFFDYKIDGFESIVLGYGTDAFSLSRKQLKNKILYGPGSIHVAHGANEFVSTDDLIKAVEDYKKLVKYGLK